METAELHTVITSLEAAHRSAHAAQVAVLEALRKFEAQAEHRPGGSNWDWKLDGSGLEGIPDSVGILTVRETAELLKISPNAVYELVRRRQLPAIHIGSRIRIGRRGLVAYLRGMNADDFDALIRAKASGKLE